MPIEGLLPTPSLHLEEDNCRVGNKAGSPSQLQRTKARPTNRGSFLQTGNKLTIQGKNPERHRKQLSQSGVDRQEILVDIVPSAKAKPRGTPAPIKGEDHVPSMNEAEWVRGLELFKNARIQEYNKLYRKAFG